MQKEFEKAAKSYKAETGVARWLVSNSSAGFVKRNFRRCAGIL